MRLHEVAGGEADEHEATDRAHALVARPRGHPEHQQAAARDGDEPCDLRALERLQVQGTHFGQERHQRRGRDTGQRHHHAGRPCQLPQAPTSIRLLDPRVQPEPGERGETTRRQRVPAERIGLRLSRQHEEPASRIAAVRARQGDDGEQHERPADQRPIPRQPRDDPEPGQDDDHDAEVGHVLRVVRRRIRVPPVAPQRRSPEVRQGEGGEVGPRRPFR